MSNVYVYDITVTDIYSEEDFGSITSSLDDSEDYQQISTLYTSQDDWYVITNTSTQIPFGSIGNISGSATERETNIYEAQGSIEISEIVDTNVTFTWVGNGTLFEIGNGLERTLNPYISSGTLRFEVGIFEYNTNSFDNQLITFDSSLITLDTSEIRYDAVISFTSNPPENTQLYLISGSSSESLEKYYATSGSLSIFGELNPPNIDYTPSYTGGGVINIFASTLETNTESYVGLETLSLHGSALESYSRQTPEETQLFDISGISSTREIQIYGINPGNHLYPQPVDISSGIVTITNTALIHPFVDYTPHYGIDKNIGVGTTGIKLSGSAILSDTEFYFGTGVLLGFGEKIERRTYNYDETDIIEFESFDYQLITLSLDQPSEDYGNLSYTPSSDVFGFIYDPLTGQPIESTIYPFGSIYISGISSNREIQVYGKDYVTTGNIIISGISSNREIQVYGKDYVTTGIVTVFGTLAHPNIDYTPHYGIEKNIGIGTTGIQISGISTAVEKFITNPPENTQLFVFSSGYSDLRSTHSEVGIGTLYLSGQKIESETDSYVGLGTVKLSGTAVEKVRFDTPEDTILFKFDETENGRGVYSLNQKYVSQVPSTALTLYGELVHPNIDYTPHYGIEKNIGIGTTGIRFLRGVGYIPDSEGIPRDARTYSNVYPRNDKVPNTGIGTFRFDQTNNTAKYGVLTPYKGTGLFNIVSGFSPQEQYPWLTSPGVGRSWSFSKSNYNASGFIKLDGIASTREIAVYGYYGNDDNPGTSGTIFISQQTAPFIEKNVNSYVGTGTYFISDVAILVDSDSYNGSGSVTIAGSALEVYSAQTPEETQLFSISGSALEVYSAQTPEIEVLYIINGSLVERVTNSYNGSGSITLSGSARTIEVPNYPSRGLLRFVSHTIDHDYDTCDSEELTCDDQDSANISFVANPIDTTVLFNIDGIASTKEILRYEYSGIGTYVISGSVQNIKLTHTEVGVGTIFEISSSMEDEVDVYVGSGSLFTISGASQYYSAQTPESTILISISGSATTRIESKYSVVGIGIINITGVSTTKKISTYTQIGSGIVTLFGELVYPDIIYIPSPDGFGTINIIGSSDNSLTKIYRDTSGTLFEFSSGLESFSRSPYVGLGTIYIQETSGSTLNNPFQIPRTYVVII
jgi:hypothetical protein